MMHEASCGFDRLALLYSTTVLERLYTWQAPEER
jgi:hypothetical protein